jgi:4'-phosphopantetheinyl transferase
MFKRSRELQTDLKLTLITRLSSEEYIRCCFGRPGRLIQERGETSISFIIARISDFHSIFEKLNTIISKDEKERASRFVSGDDKVRYIICHGLLRLILSVRLITEPGFIEFTRNKHGKPFVPGNSLFFSFSHTRELVGIALFQDAEIGADIEKIDMIKKDDSIISLIFSTDEIKYISERESDERFFLLWTRKEALLKSIGLGLIDSLTQVEVHRKGNFIDPSVFGKVHLGQVSHRDQFVYSFKHFDHFLSISVPIIAGLEIYSMTV